MEWLIWVCITAGAAGACVTERYLTTRATSRADCQDAARSVRVEPVPAAQQTVGEATSVEMATAPGGRVVVACTYADPKTLVPKP